MTCTHAGRFRRVNTRVSALSADNETLREQYVPGFPLWI